MQLHAISNCQKQIQLNKTEKHYFCMKTFRCGENKKKTKYIKFSAAPFNVDNTNKQQSIKIQFFYRFPTSAKMKKY